jgi:hypothetical protein
MWGGNQAKPPGCAVTTGHFGGIAHADGPADRPNCTDAVWIPFTDRR